MADKKKAKTKYTNNQFWSVILFSLGILVMLFAVIEGSAGWFKIHIALRGLFGISVFAVPVILTIIAYMIAQEKEGNDIARIVIQGAVLIVIISAVIQIIFIGSVEGNDFNYKIKSLYSSGAILHGGGVVSAVLAIPLISFFGETGAKIIITLMLFVLIMLISNISLMELFGFFKKPFKSMKNVLNGISEQGIGQYLFSFNGPDFDDDDDEDEEEIKQIPQKREKFISKLISTVKIANKDEDEEENEKDNEIIDIISSAADNVPECETEKNPVEWEDIADGRSDNDSIIDVEIFENDTDDDKDNTDSHKTGSLEDGEREEVDIELLLKKSAEENKSIKLKKEQEIEKILEENIHKPEKPKKTKYIFPPLDMLKSSSDGNNSAVSSNEMKQTAERLVDTLNSFGVQTRVIGISRGPTVTRYELQPSAGVKVSKIVNLADDIALNLAAAGVRIEAPIPGKPAVGIEIPNKNKDTVSLRELLESNEFRRSKSKLSFAVGRDIAGDAIIGDIAKMPHVIIAGSTGSGKSVCTNSIIMSILYKATPDEVRLVLIDPKIVEFKVYDGIPHLLVPVVTDPKKAAGALNWAVQEMLRRYQLFADNNVRDITGYNEYAQENDNMEKMPQIVIAIDELADLMMASKDAVEDAICRLAQMARAAGMHLIIATQRPTVDIITGLIKANIPSRIALSVMSQTDSRTILDTGGADKLLGKGDMLYFPSGIPKPVRVQGCFCSTKEIESVVNFIKNQSQAEYSDEILDEIEKNIPVQKGSKNTDSAADVIPVGNDEMLIERAIDIVVEMGQASTSSLQRKLKLGYARAARIVDELEEMGVVGPSEGAKPRRVIMSKSQWAERKLRQKDGQE
ncbi:MAG: DNA translocase FtsK 4TM domain-containing protein [Oscillospiraceae bacterium]